MFAGASNRLEVNCVSRLARKEGPSVATARPKTKSAMNTLMDQFSKMAAEESTRMTDTEFKRAVKGSKEIINRVRASRERKRGRA